MSAVKVTLLLYMLHIAALAHAQSFNVLVVGGAHSATNATVYNVLSPEKGCALPSLVGNAPQKPLLGLMDGNVTACGGYLRHCNYFDTNKNMWMESFSSPLAPKECHVTTFDYHTWTIIQEGSYIYVWKQGMNSFSDEKTGFYLGNNRCSVRINQTHAISSDGGTLVLLYQEEGYKFERLPELDSHWRSNANCGLYLNPDNGFQYVNVGGNQAQDGRTVVLHLDSNSWGEGPSLPSRVTSTAHTQFQNTLIVIASAKDSDEYIDIFSYDDEEGWLELEAKLNYHNYNMGMMHLPPGKLKCKPTTLV